MATKYWLVKTDPKAAVCRKNDVDAMVVVAETSADAIAISKSKTSGDVNGLWDGATVTEMVVAADLEAWTLHVLISTAAGAVVADCSVTGAASATIDSIAALMVIALNATTPIAGSAYNAGTQVLTVAQTTDNLGDHVVAVQFKPPAATHDNPIAIPGLVVSKVDAGLSTAALTVTFAGDSYTRPKVVGQVKQVA